MKNKLADVVRETWMKEDAVLIAAALDPCVKLSAIAPPKVADLKIKFLRVANLHAHVTGQSVCRSSPSTTQGETVYLGFCLLF